MIIIIESKFENLISLKDGAKIVNKEESTIRKHILKGVFAVGIDCKKFGKQWVFDKDALFSVYLKEGTMKELSVINRSKYENLINLLSKKEYTTGRIYNYTIENYQLFFNIIDRTLIGNELNADRQCKSLKNLLAKEDTKTINLLNNMWLSISCALSDYINNDIENKKEIVEEYIEQDKHWRFAFLGSDDGFTDFCNWVVGRGSSFIEHTIEEGIEYVLDYIIKYNIRDADYESLYYPFLDYIDLDKKDNIRDWILEDYNGNFEEDSVNYFFEFLNDSVYDNETNILEQIKEMELTLKEGSEGDRNEINRIWNTISFMIKNRIKSYDIMSDLNIDEERYDDFISWIISRGEDFINMVLDGGTSAIIDYIKENNISCSEYTTSIFNNLLYKYKPAEKKDNDNSEMNNSTFEDIFDYLDYEE